MEPSDDFIRSGFVRYYGSGLTGAQILAISIEDPTVALDQWVSFADELDDCIEFSFECAPALGWGRERF